MLVASKVEESTRINSVAFLPLAMEQLLSGGAEGSGEVTYAGQAVLLPGQREPSQ